MTPPGFFASLHDGVGTLVPHARHQFLTGNWKPKRISFYLTLTNHLVYSLLAKTSQDDTPDFYNLQN